MPSRKSETSETHTDSRRESLRRLSSLASLQALINPFARRRSNQTDASTAASSTSNLSISSTAANAPQIHKCSLISSSPLFPIQDELTEVPVPPVPTYTASRHGSYVCMPDDPIGGMPRSRTFSNLPLPTRAWRNNGMVGSKSHARLPSTVLAPTRLPTPPASTRRHSNMRPTPADAKPSVIKNRAKRSDTEPLLSVKRGQGGSSHVGRSTAFKENLTFSPVKPLPPMRVVDNKDFHGSSLPSRADANKTGEVDYSECTEHFLQSPSDFISSLPLPHYRQRSLVSFAQSSPAYRSARERPATPSASKPEPVQRWNSQPILSSITNRRNSRHDEILERRLMSAVLPVPPPPPPKTPLATQASTSGKLKKSLHHSMGHMRQASEQSPSLEHPSNKPRTTSPRKPPTANLPTHGTTLQIAHPEPVAYWCGRFAALNDRYRNEELSLHLNGPRRQSDSMHTPENNARRMRRALEHLHTSCVTVEAREAFAVFQAELAKWQGLPDLGRPFVVDVGRRILLGGIANTDGVGDDREGCSASEKRERSFMERLLGRGKKGEA